MWGLEVSICGMVWRGWGLLHLVINTTEQGERVAGHQPLVIVLELVLVLAIVTDLVLLVLTDLVVLVQGVVLVD